IAARWTHVDQIKVVRVTTIAAGVAESNSPVTYPRPAITSTGAARTELLQAQSVSRCPASDLEGGGHRARRALRPVLVTARRIEPFPCTGLPLLARPTAEGFFETRGRYLDDGQGAFSRGKLRDGFCLDGFEGRLEAAG